MKLRYIIPAFALMFISCEEVIDVDLNTAEPRLVVDASIDWVKGTDGSQQTIRLTKTTGYYSDVIPPASGAIVTVSDQDGNTFDFIENPGTGNYICGNFAPQMGMTYTLTIEFESQQYTAEETLLPVPDIENFEQDNDGGFLGDEIEVRFYFQDDPAVENYYQVKFDTPVLAFPEYEAISDEFTNGNLMSEWFAHEDLAPGQLLDVRLYGVSERYHNYMQKLLSVAGSGASGPFGTALATVRGNVRNLTDAKKYPLGYFRLCEVDVASYLVE